MLLRPYISGLSANIEARSVIVVKTVFQGERRVWQARRHTASTDRDAEEAHDERRVPREADPHRKHLQVDDKATDYKKDAMTGFTHCRA